MHPAVVAASWELRYAMTVWSAGMIEDNDDDPKPLPPEVVEEIIAALLRKDD